MATIRARRSTGCSHPAGQDCTGCAWRVEWRSGGRSGTRESCTFLTGQQAAGAARLVEARHHRITSEIVYAAVLGLEPDGRDRQTPTVAEWSIDWIASRRRIGDVQPDTIDGQQSIITRHILPELGRLPLSIMTQDMVRDWVGWMTRQPSPRGGTLDADTVRHAHGVLHSLLGAAVPKWIQANPAARLPGQARSSSGLPKPTRHEAVFLTAGEVDRIIDCCPAEIRDLVFVAVRTGLRLGELLALRVEDVTATGSRKVVRVRRTLKRGGGFGPPKSRRSRRDVSISAEVAAVLREHTAGRRRTDLVFVAPNGGAWNPANLASRCWLPALARAQRCTAHPPPEPPKPARGPARKLRPDEVSACDCPTRLHRRPRFHDLRHTHVSLCIEAGWEPARVSRRIGHESVQMTIDWYGHLWDIESDDRLDAVERLLVSVEGESA